VGHILIVDDNEMNRDVLGRRMEQMHHSFALAEDGLDALEALRQDVFDLVLLDVMMPRMDGYEVLQHIKADPTLKYLPIVMISADHELESVMKCIELGADDYLFKPFNTVLLKTRITNILEQYQAREENPPEEVLISSENLREPITHAMNCVDQLLNQVAGPINETQVELLGLVQSRLAQMMGMIVSP
jgi:CheY-like chemotaxis protein